jgi:hypothetical protein
MTDFAAIRSELEALSTLVGAARAIMGDGRAVDLAGFDRRVGALCQSMQSLGVKDAQSLKPVLIALLDDIERLKHDLLAQQEALGTELKRLGAGHKTASAYHRPSGR